MLAQRRDTSAPKSNGKGRSAAAEAGSEGSTIGSPSAQAAKSTRKLSFKEKHALETLPAEISRLESEIKALSAKLADASLFTRDRAAFDETSRKLAVAQKKLDTAETQWLELEDLRAALDARS